MESGFAQLNKKLPLQVAEGLGSHKVGSPFLRFFNAESANSAAPFFKKVPTVSRIEYKKKPPIRRLFISWLPKIIRRQSAF